MATSMAFARCPPATRGQLALVGIFFHDVHLYAHVFKHLQGHLDVGTADHTMQVQE